MRGPRPAGSFPFSWGCLSSEFLKGPFGVGDGLFPFVGADTSQLGEQLVLRDSWWLLGSTIVIEDSQLFEEQHGTIPISPIVGIAAVAGGIAVVTSSRTRV